MAPIEIRFDPEEVAFILDGERPVEISRDDAIVAPLAVVDRASISSFERALEAYEDQDGAVVDTVFLADVPPEQFDADTSPRTLALGFLENRLSVRIGQELRHDRPEVEVARLLSPLLDRLGGEVVGRYRDDQGGRDFEIFMVAMTDREAQLGELYTLGIEAKGLIDATADTNSLTAASTRDLLATGLARALLGQPETSWIDAKAVPHATGSEAAKFELAKDVAAFANTGEDAVIVYGIATDASTTGDVLDVLRPFKLSTLDIPALRSTLKDRLVPVLTDLEVKAVEVRAGYGYGWIFIPAQPPWIRPVLVRGALIGGQVSGSHFSVPFRVGEETAHWDASTVHSLIQAGRVGLQREPSGPGGSEPSSG